MAIASTSPISIPSVPSPNPRSIRSVQFGVQGSIGRFERSLNCRRSSVRCGGSSDRVLRTCKNCKKQFDVSLNHDQACRFHTAHFGGETKRKFESVYTGGTMSTPDAGRVFEYWHCCGSEDPFDAGCTATRHCSYDD
ncbi:hypothetical protein QJS04_geneDACA017633 [Acorus gramineus]|uniref:Uncharacterized protein n=1 Tax=Acorus gramineus TaxID=55184 RepID=A0AAV9AWQ6_ACOGR|nr:hypothetical protein QJS04_geneDACA017633 [Acorus gramineus]